MEKAMAIVRKIQKLNLRKGKDAIFTWSRAALVVPQMIGHRIAVHNGRKHLSVHITEHMVGHKLGEFSRTRTFRGHAGMKANLQKQKKKK